MTRTGFVVAVVFGLMAHQASAQALPAENPPASYTGTQYVDSKGCAFIRAGIGGVTNWVPRVTRQRVPMCGFQPSLPRDVARAPQPVQRPTAGVTEITIAATPAPAATRPRPAAAAPVAARPATTRPAASVGAPIPTVASITTPPRVAAASPQVITVPAPRRMTRAEICDGKTGVQPGYISSRTGQPIDCGPGQVAAAVVPAPAPTRAAPTGERLSLAQICADIDATGRRYVNGRTGAEVRCGPQTQPVSAGRRVANVAAPVIAPVAPPPVVRAPVVAAPLPVQRPQAVAPAGTATVAAPVYSVPAPTCGTTYGPVSRGAAVRCGPQTQSPSGVTRAIRSGAAVVSPSAALPQGNFLGQRPPPFSNPTGVSTAAVRPPAGYSPVWTDGRLNPNRGQTGGVVATAKDQVSTRTTPQPTRAATDHRYVQVGTFANPGNADAAAQRLIGLGMTARMGTITRNGQVFKVVVAGPFGSATDLQSALAAARRSGFSDAFTRR